MDDLLDFFNPDKPLVRKVLHGGSTSNYVESTEQEQTASRNSEYDNSDRYAEPYLRENNQLLMQKFEQHSNHDNHTGNRNEQRTDSVYMKYDFDRQSPNPNLPIASYKSQILAAVRNNPFVIVQGATGCGKTTQVPQYIIDDARANGHYCNIVVAQPRRIAASSNAERVASERNWPASSVVGYQIGSDGRENMSDDTRILFCTTGILLEKLIRSKNFANYTHLILDEVHERNKDMDFLFIVIRKLFASVSPKTNVKVILMSATIESRAFANYFKFPKNGIFQAAPVISIEHKSKFSVSEYYLEEFHNVAPRVSYSQVKWMEPTISDEFYTIAMHLISSFDKIDANEKAHRSQSAVLVFLPGMLEISQMDTFLKENWSGINENEIMCVILHSMSSREQRERALSTKIYPGVRKIILATNIAESSITVPDVKYVLDFCLSRALVTDTTTNFSSLSLIWAARSNCKQRAGRTGRVKSGKCYRFVDKYFYESEMKENATPEILSSRLENIILKSKMLEMGSPLAILALAMDKPRLQDIANSILVLKEIGALLCTCDGQANDLDGDISAIGRIMVNLPVDVIIARFIILGYCFNVLDECIIIGAALSCSKNVLRVNATKHDSLRAYSQQLQWANGSGSDLLAMLNAYKEWQHNFPNSSREQSDFVKRSEREWASESNVDIDALYECRSQSNDIHQRLERFFDTANDSNRMIWCGNEKEIALKLVIAGAFYPNYFVQQQIGSENNFLEAYKCVGGRDPRNTIYFTGFSSNYIRPLYTKSIKNYFVANDVVDEENANDIIVSFDFNSKVFVTFNTDERSAIGNIPSAVYKSIKMNELRTPIRISVISSAARENDYVNKLHLTIAADGSINPNSPLDYGQICLPRVLDKSMQGFITHIESCSEFWFQPKQRSEEVNEFERSCVNRAIKKITIDQNLFVGKIVIVGENISGDEKYHRGKILRIKYDSYLVKLIDIGRTISCGLNKLFEYCGTLKRFMSLPPRCFVCRLAQMQPTQFYSPNGLWSSDLNKLFKEKTYNREIKIDIYSMANGKANVFVYCEGSSESLNDIFCQTPFAEHIDEDYLSKTNSRERWNNQNFRGFNQSVRVDSTLFDLSTTQFLNETVGSDVVPPGPQLTDKTIKLNGPNSALEIKLLGISQATKNRMISIDRHSVNSVLLDDCPRDAREKYVVAATVSESDQNRFKLNLRQTTTMPRIHAFVPLAALLFGHTMQVRRDYSNSHYTTVRVGLGYNDEKRRPMFEEHDVTFNFRVEIDQSDIEMVNEVRSCLNTLLCNQRRPNSNSFEARAKIKTLTKELLEKPRKPINQKSDELEWNPLFPNDIDCVEPHLKCLYGDRAIFPLHNTLKTRANPQCSAK